MILVLTCDPARPCLDQALARLGAGAARVLAPGIAAELPDGDLAAARAALADIAVDVNLVPIAHRRKRLLVADMESTLIENEMLDDLADRLGIGPSVHAITRRAMNGELDFRAALEARVKLLAGQSAGLLDDVAAGIRVMPGARALIQTMRAHGARTAIVSGGFRFFTARVRAQLGADCDEANVLTIADGRITGAVEEPVLTKESKLAALQRLSAELKLDPAATLAVGDGANDLPMLQAAGLGVAFRAKPTVQAAVAVNIRHGDLTALLYLQGYTQAEMVG